MGWRCFFAFILKMGRLGKLETEEKCAAGKFSKGQWGYPLVLLIHCERFKTGKRKDRGAFVRMGTR